MGKKNYDLNTAAGFREWFADNDAKVTIDSITGHFKPDEIDLKEFIDYEKMEYIDQEGLIGEMLRVQAENKKETEVEEVTTEAKGEEDEVAISTQIDDKSGATMIVPISSLKRNSNIRSDDAIAQEGEEFDDFVANIAEKGVLQPLLVNKNMEVIAGYRRLAAAEIAKLETVPVFVKDITKKEVAELQLTENLQRKNLSHVDLIRGIAKMKEETEKKNIEIAKIVGLDSAQISSILKTYETVPEKILDFINQERANSFTLSGVLGLQHLTVEEMEEHILGIEKDQKVTAKDIKEIAKKPTEKDDTEPDYAPDDDMPEPVSMSQMEDLSLGMLLQQLEAKLEKVIDIEDTDVLELMNRVNNRLVEIMERSV